MLKNSRAIKYISVANEIQKMKEGERIKIDYQYYFF